MMQKIEYSKIGGDHAIGSLLAQVHYWTLPAANGKAKLRVVRHGKFWIAKTREEWCAETGLSLDQYKRAISVLKRRGLVEARIMKFNGQPMTHICLRIEVFDASLQFVRSLPSGAEATNQVVEKPLSKWGQSHQSSGGFHATPGTVITDSSTNSISSCEEKNHLATGENTPVKSEQGKKGKTVNAEEILKNLQAKKYGNSSKTCPAMHWMERTAALIGKFQTTTQKFLGQMKMFRTKIGDAADPIRVIDFAFDEWWSFSKKAETQCGLKDSPTNPEIGFALQHINLLVNMYLQSIAPEPQPGSAVSKPVAIPAMPTAETELPYKPSWDELQGLLASASQNAGMVQ